MHYEPPTFRPPHRVLLLVAATDGWYQAADAGVRERIVARLRSFFDRWQQEGARLLGTFDDDYFVVGQPSSLGYSIFALWDVDDVAFIPTVMNSLREDVDGVRLDSCFRMEVRVGRNLFVVES